MLYIDAERLQGRERVYAQFWNLAHTVEHLRDGWVLALWYDKKPRRLPEARRPPVDEPLVAFGWPRARTPGYTVAPLDLLLTQSSLLDCKPLVALAQWHSLPGSIQQLLRQNLGYDPKIPGQVEGWWFTEDSELPHTAPAYRPTGSLLPEGGTLNDGCKCLVLAELDDYWMVLSEPGARTYVFGSRLLEAEPVFFLDHSAFTWSVSLDASLTIDGIAARFGQAAHERSRDDAPGLLVEVRSHVV